jgi:3'-5' exoribonuclease
MLWTTYGWLSKKHTIPDGNLGMKSFNSFSAGFLHMLEKKVYVKDLVPNQNIEDIFVVKFRKPVRSYSNGYTFVLRLSDASGDTMLKYWGGNDRTRVEQVYESVKQDDVILVKGTTASYKDRVEIHVNEGQGFIRVCKRGEYDEEAFIKRTKKDVEEMYRRLIGYIDTVQNPEYRRVLEAFFKEDKEFIEAFKDSPGAMYKHHNWLGGLLEHTLAVTNIALDVAKHHKELDRDLLIAGSLLHDIGKVRELEVRGTIRVSVEGQLLGHIVLGIEMLSEKLRKLQVSKQCYLKLMHMLVAHHGNNEYGSPKTPAFPEALVVYYADELDSKAASMIDVRNTAQTEDKFLNVKDFGNVYLE